MELKRLRSWDAPSRLETCVESAEPVHDWPEPGMTWLRYRFRWPGNRSCLATLSERTCRDIERSKQTLPWPIKKVAYIEDYGAYVIARTDSLPGVPFLWAAWCTVRPLLVTVNFRLIRTAEVWRLKEPTADYMVPSWRRRRKPVHNGARRDGMTHGGSVSKSS